jgi:glycogen operon protein
MYLDGRGIRHRDPRGRPVIDRSYLMWFNAAPETVTVEIPGPPWAHRYELLLSTEYPTGEPPRPTAFGPGTADLPARCVWLLRAMRRP